MAQTSSQLTEAQSDMIATLDDVSEHVAWEFDSDNYHGPSTVGFAHISLDGNSSFASRIRSLSKSGCPHVEHNERRDEYRIQVGGLELSLRSGHDGYRLTVSNVKDYIGGPEFQRLDVRERLHSLVLERLRHNGYLEDHGQVRSRMD
jgi:hypothetical protein